MTTTRAMLVVCASAAVVLWAATAGALGPGEKCQALKNNDTGKLAACLQKAEMKLVSTKGLCGDPVDQECYRDSDCNDACVKNTEKYDSIISKCNGKFLSGWAKGEAKGATQCPDGIADPNSMLDFVAAHSSAVATALAGDALPADVESCNADLATCEADLSSAQLCGNGTVDPDEDCDFGDLDGATCVTLGYSYGRLQCGAGCLYDTTACDIDAKLVFVTSTVHDGNLGGLAGADAICQSLATAAGLEGTWVAWLSTQSPAVLAPDRITDAEYRLVDRLTIVANNRLELTIGGQQHAIDMTENEVTLGSGTVYTGTDQDILAHYTCADWTSATSPDQGTWGNLTSSGSEFTDMGYYLCDQERRLYCFQQ